MGSNATHGTRFLRRIRRSRQAGPEGSVTGLHRYSTTRRIAGRVLTVKLDRAEGRSNTRHLCTAAIEAAMPGDIIVVEQRTGIDAASWGGNLAIGAKMRSVAGVIVEGPARDIDDCSRLDFPVFAREHTARTARGRIVEVATNEPITVGDVVVSPGDYAIADGSGVVFVAAKRYRSRPRDRRRPSWSAKKPWRKRCAKAIPSRKSWAQTTKRMLKK